MKRTKEGVRILASLCHFSAMTKPFPLLRIVAFRIAFVAQVSTLWILNSSPVSAQSFANGQPIAEAKVQPWYSTVTLPAAAPVTWQEAVVIKKSDSSVVVFDVANGAGEIDLTLTQGLREEGGACGFSKEGAGTMAVSGKLDLHGVITVKQGLLDLSRATLLPQARLNLAKDARIRVPNSTIHALWFSGQKQAAGRWGAPGSVAAKLADFESPSLVGPGILTVTDNTLSRREQFRRMKYGFFVHYVWDGGGGATPIRVDGSKPGSIDQLADEFDAKGFANDMEKMGVECVFFTAWHANHYPLYPSAITDRVAGGPRSPKRDMLGDMIDACRAKGIRVLFYTHPCQPVFREIDWSDYVSGLYAELTDRYGDRIDGMYMDENDPGGRMQLDFLRMGRAIRLRNPDLVLVQNNYGNLYANDMPVGEWLSQDGTDPMQWGMAQSFPIAHTIASSWMAHQTPQGSRGMSYTGTGIYRFTVISAGSCTEGGGMLWATGPYVGGGGWERGVLEEMTKAGDLIRASGESVRHTYPSRSYPTASGTSITQLDWGVATRSPDDRTEFLHVLRPPTGKVLTLPPPADGKRFAKARLYPSQKPIALVQDAQGLKLTLGDDDNWNPVDTIIALDVTHRGGRCLTNNTHPAIRYQGQSWELEPQAAEEWYEGDRHVALTNGDRFGLNFEGTDIVVLGSPSPDQGVVDYFLDGKLHRSVDLSRGSGKRRAVLEIRGLRPGKHSLVGVKRSGTRMVVDAFQISELINNDDPRIRYTRLTTFNDNASDPNHPLAHISYSPGNWQPQQRDWNEYNLDVTWSQNIGASFTVKFNGNGIILRGNGIGVADFFLDGKFVKQTDFGKGPRSHCVGVDLNGLEPGWHELRGVMTGGPYLQVDSFSVYHTSPVDWKRASVPGRGCVNDDVHVTTANDEMAMFEFEGEDLDVYAPAFDRYGTGQYWIDDQAVHLSNHYRDHPVGSMLTFSCREVKPLTPGKHKLRVVLHRGEKLGLDAIRIYRKPK